MTTLKHAKYGILSIDPSITNVGISYQIFSFTPIALVSEVKYIETYRPKLKGIQKEYFSRFPEDESISDSQALRAVMIYERISELIRTYSPDAIAMEAGFINVMRPSAVIPLVRVTQSITMASRILKGDVCEYAPTRVKKLFSGMGNVDKDGMTAALTELIEVGALSFSKEVDPSTLTEHSVDSIAIGHAHIHTHREKLYQDYLKNA